VVEVIMRILRILRVVMVVLVCGGLPGRVRAELSEVWAVDDGTKVKRDDVEHPLRLGNGSFDRSARRVRLFGLRDEVVAFQVILLGGASETRGVRVRTGGVGEVRNGAVSDAPERYLLDRHVELFEEHYLNVTRRSDPRLPPGMAGPIPDALIPHRRPLVVAAGANQGVWVDLYVPREARAGVHRGEVVVELDGTPCTAPGCRLAVELEVGRQTLPPRSAARTMLYFSPTEHRRGGLDGRYLPPGATPAQLAALHLRHYQLARHHRLTLFSGIDEQRGEELEALLSGRAFTREAGYHGPGEGLGQDLYSIHTYGSGTLTPEEARRWVEWFKAHGPGVEYLFYTHDEPNDRRLFPGLNAKARAGQPVPAFVTARWQPGLEMDIYCTAPGEYDLEEVKRAREAGKRVWIYNGEPGRTGTFLSDDVAISTRVNPWIQWRHQIPRWFYWESTYYVDFQGGRGAVDLFHEAITFSNKSGDRLCGDGVLFYPGRDRVFPAEDRGLDLPLPSVRLKGWRRGVQDVDYLELARGAGLGAFAERVAATLVPRALSEASPGEPPSWPEDGERWLEARRLLFQALQRGAEPESDLARLARPRERWTARGWRLLRRWAAPYRVALLGVLVLALVGGVVSGRRARARG